MRLAALELLDAKREHQGVALAARGQATVEVQVDDAIRALAIVHTAIESDRQGGKAVEVKPFLDAVGVA